MKRRAFISSVAMVSIAGCTGGSDEPRRLDAYTASVQGPGEQLGYSAEVVQGTYADAGQPVTIELTIMNLTEDTVTFSDKRDASFFTAQAENHGLYPADIRSTAYSYNSNVDAWVLDSPYEQTSDIQMARLEPDENLTQRLYLFLRDASDAGEKSPSVLEFEQTIQVGTTQEDRQADEKTIKLTLSLLDE